MGAALIAGGSLLSACGGSSESGSPGGTPVAGGNLRVGLAGGGPTETLDPYFQVLAPDLLRCFALYAYIGEIDGDYRGNPLLAESVEMADDTATAWDIRLKQHLEFHDGKTVSADDLVFSLNRMLDPKGQSSAVELLPWVDLKQLRKLDDRTVRVVLDRPVSVFDQCLYNFLSTVVPVDFDPKKPIGAGPFRFTSFSAGDRSVFTRFENYFDHPANVDQLEVITFSDDTALVNALLGGEIDIAGGVSPASSSVAQQAGMPIVVTPSIGWQPLTMRMDQAPFDDPRVREAFRLIPDRSVMLKQAFSDRGATRNDMYGWDSDGFPADLARRAQDLSKARALLKDAGAENLVVDLPTTASFAGQIEICQVFAEQAKEIGITVNVISTTPDTFYSKYYLTAPFASDTFFNVPYLNNTLQCQLPSSPYNASHWADDEFQVLYGQALGTTDAKARAAVVGKMQQIQYERGALLIASSFDGLDATAANVHGLESDQHWAYPLNGFHVERVWLA